MKRNVMHRAWRQYRALGYRHHDPEAFGCCLKVAWRTERGRLDGRAARAPKARRFARTTGLLRYVGFGFVAL